MKGWGIEKPAEIKAWYHASLIDLEILDSCHWIPTRASIGYCQGTRFPPFLSFVQLHAMRINTRIGLVIHK